MRERFLAFFYFLPDQGVKLRVSNPGVEGEEDDTYFPACISYTDVRYLYQVSSGFRGPSLWFCWGRGAVEVMINALGGTIAEDKCEGGRNR